MKSLSRLITRDRDFYQTLFRLAIPVALQNLITFSVGFADNLMVSSLGDTAVSGVYLGGQLQTFLQIFSGGVSGAILILSSQYWGKKDTASIKRLLAIGMRFCLCIGLLLTTVCFIFPHTILSIFTSDADVIAQGRVYLRIVCLSYTFFCVSQMLIAAMRSVEIVKISTLVATISLFTNILLNDILIFGKLGFQPLGIAGAAIATLISRVIEAAIMLFYVLAADRKLKLHFLDFLSGDRLLLRDFLSYGLPIVGGEVLWSINVLVSSMILGRYPASVITSASLANTLGTFVYIGMSGLSSATGVITGKTVGSGETDKMKEYAYTTQLLFATLGICICGFMLLLRDPYLSLYTNISPAAANTSREFINVLAIATAGTSYQAAGLFGLVKSGGDVNFVFKNDAIFVFGVVLPSAILASWLQAAPWIVFACLKCDQVLKCVVAFFKINSFNWIKQLARDC